MGIQPGTHRRTAQRQLCYVRQALFDMLEVMLQHRHPAGDFLPEGQRRSVLQVGTANLDDIAKGAGFGFQGGGELVK